MTQEIEARAINASTLVNVGLVIVLLGAVFSGTRWASGLENHIISANFEQSYRIEMLDLKLEQLRAEIQTGVADRWTRTDQEMYHGVLEKWVDTFRANNQTLTIPHLGAIPEKRK
jgi:hypothetical protein